MIVSNIYIHAEDPKKHKLDTLLELVEELANPYIKIPILLYGDFNLNPSVVKAAVKSNHCLYHNHNLRVYESYHSPFQNFPLATRTGTNKNGIPVYSQIDFILTNLPIKTKWSFHPLLSDHAFVIVQIEKKDLGCKSYPLYLPMRQELGTLIFNSFKQNNKDSNQFSNLLDFLTKEREKFMAKITPRDFRESLDCDLATSNLEQLTKQWIAKFAEFASSIIKLRFSSDQAKAFKLIRSVTKYNKDFKRDGAIITSLSAEYDLPPTDNKAVAEALIGQLKSNDLTMTDMLGKYGCPVPEKLPDLEDHELRVLVTKVSKGKAMPDLLFPDDVLHKLASDQKQNVLFLNQLWDPQFIEKHKIILKTKLVPLNKIFPKVPSKDDMRPICVTSSLFKLIEARFTAKLTQAFISLKDPLAKAQVGFIPQMSTQTNILRLLESIHQTFTNWPEKIPKVKLKNDHIGIAEEGYSSAILFLDYSQAYNSVNKHKLFGALVAGDILDPNESNPPPLAL